MENAGGEIWACQLLPKTAKNSGRVYFYETQLPVVCVTTPGCASVSRKKVHGDNERIHGDYGYMLDKNASSISGDGNGGERQSLLMLISP